MMGKSCVDVLRDVTGDNGIETVAEGLEKALNGGGGGGGGGDFVVTHIENGAGNTLVGDMTYSEMQAEISDGKILFARFANPYMVGTGIVTALLGENGQLTADFNGMKIIIRASSGDDNNVWSFVED